METTVRKHFNDPTLWVAQWGVYSGTGRSKEEARANLLDALRVAGVRLSGSCTTSTTS